MQSCYEITFLRINRAECGEVWHLNRHFTFIKKYRLQLFFGWISLNASPSLSIPRILLSMHCKSHYLQRGLVSCHDKWVFETFNGEDTNPHSPVATAFELRQLRNNPCPSGFEGQGRVALSGAHNYFKDTVTDFILSVFKTRKATFKS